MDHYIHTKSGTNFEQTIQLVTEALKVEGFGVITEVNVHEKLKEKLGINSRRYNILEVCNASYVNKVLQKDNAMSTTLLFNVIIRELVNNEIEVVAMDPVATLRAIEDIEMVKLTREIQGKLTKAIMSLHRNPHSHFYF